MSGRHGRTLAVVGASIWVAACAADTVQPEGYQVSTERDDGTSRGAVRSDAGEPTVETVDIAAYIGRHAARGRLSPAPSTAPAFLDRSSLIAETNQFVRERAAALDPEETMRVVLDLGDIPFPEASYFRDLSPEQRALVIQDRKALLESEQRAFVAYLEDLGAVVHETVGAFNQVRAEIPARAMEDVLAREEVKELHPSWNRAVPLYDLEEGRQATFIDEFWAQGLEGQLGGPYGNVRVAVIEVHQVALLFFGPVNNTIDEPHPGWKDGASGPSRILINRDCAGISGLSACLNQTTGGDGAHGTWVTSILAGDITEGQDPAITDPLERLRRTGMVPEASILYFQASYPDEIAAAVFNAVGAGADVVNLSLAYECDPQPRCSATTNCGGVNEMIRFATESGTLIVAAAGNNTGICYSPGPPDCTVCQPAVRPEVLAVGNIHTPAGLPYDDAQIAGSSSRGWVRVGIAGQYASSFPNGVDVPAVSIAAPGTFSHFFFGTNHEYLDWGGQYQTGTSLASPVVAGAAALMRQELWYGHPFHYDVNMLRAKVIAMGDGTGGPYSESYGAGKAKFHPFDSMQAPKGQGHQQFTLQENQVVTLDASHWPDPLPPEATQWKVGVDIKAIDYSAIPYVLLTYQDVCGGTRWLATDWRAGLERHMILDSQHFDDETCIRISVSGYSVPPGGVTVSVYDYYHSGDPSEH